MRLPADALTGESGGAARLGLRSGRRGTRGLTLIETTVALSLLACGALAVLGTMIYSLQLDATNRETMAASQAARRTLEQIRAADVTDVVALYNDDSTDDPDGPGTAPGSDFAITLLDQTAGGSSSKGGVGLPLDGDGALRETANLPDFGFPRDLNGDGVIDSDPRGSDYLILPVVVRVAWKGINGDREVAFRTVLR